jgi:hypothetical protein
LRAASLRKGGELVDGDRGEYPLEGLIHPRSRGYVKSKSSKKGDRSHYRTNEQVYTSIDEWRADTGLDVDSQFFIGPFRSRPDARAQIMRGALDALRREPTLRPEMFDALYRLAKEPD